MRCPFFLTMSMCIAATLGFAFPAGAQSLQNPVIGIVDVQRVLRDAKASKSVRPEVNRLRGEFQKTVKAQEQRLRKAERELARQRVILAPEAFAQKRRAFSEDARKAQENVQTRRRELDRAVNNTNNEILKKLIVVAKEVAEAKKLNILLEKRFVFISVRSLDLTKEIIERLDKKLPVVQIRVDSSGKGPAQGKK
jgi:outer membrane protein